MDAAQTEHFELLKEGLRRLLAAGAVTPEEAGALVSRIARIARFGSKLEVETMKVWPDKATARPASEFFVNERIDLLVREAETFRNDYRDKHYRNIFLALQKPLPLAGLMVLVTLLTDVEPTTSNQLLDSPMLSVLVCTCNFQPV